MYGVGFLFWVEHGYSILVKGSVEEDGRKQGQRTEKKNSTGPSNSHKGRE